MTRDDLLTEIVQQGVALVNKGYADMQREHDARQAERKAKEQAEKDKFAHAVRLKLADMLCPNLAPNLRTERERLWPRVELWVDSNFFIQLDLGEYRGVPVIVCASSSANEEIVLALGQARDPARYVSFYDSASFVEGLSRIMGTPVIPLTLADYLEQQGGEDRCLLNDTAPS